MNQDTGNHKEILRGRKLFKRMGIGIFGKVKMIYDSL